MSRLPLLVLFICACAAQRVPPVTVGSCDPECSSCIEWSILVRIAVKGSDCWDFMGNPAVAYLDTAYAMLLSWKSSRGITTVTTARNGLNIFACQRKPAEGNLYVMMQMLHTDRGIVVEDAIMLTNIIKSAGFKAAIKTKVGAYGPVNAWWAGVVDKHDC